MVAITEWDRPTNGRPREMLSEDNKNGLIVMVGISVVISMLLLACILMVENYNIHMEKMHELGFAKTAVYKSNGSYSGVEWARGDGSPITLSVPPPKVKPCNHEEITHDSAIQFLRNELEEGK